MIEQGALGEVRDLHKKISDGHATTDAPITRAIGYTELSDHLEGLITLDKAKTLACQTTRQYAKRQTTWFKNQWQPDAKYIPHKENALNDLIDQTRAFLKNINAD